MSARCGDAGRALCACDAQNRPHDRAGPRVVQVTADKLRVGSIRIAKRTAGKSGPPVWMYRFDDETHVVGCMLGGPDAMEVAYVFGTPDAVRLSGSRVERHDVAARVSSAFAVFARSGAPQVPTLPEWPTFASGRAQHVDSRCGVPGGA